MRCCYKTKKATRNPFLKNKFNYANKNLKVDEDVIFLLKGSLDIPTCRINKPGFIGTFDHTPERSIDNNYYEVLAALNAWRPKSVPPPVSQLIRRDEEKDLMQGDVYLIALDWKSLRNVKMCLCTMPFDHFTKKYHCWQCGNVFCIRCIDRHISLPGHLSQCAVPVCQPCFQKINYYFPCTSP